MMRSLLLSMAILVTGCAPPSAPHVPDISLKSTDGNIEAFPTNLANASWTVLVFFSADCPCFLAHQARLAALARAYEPRGVRFLLVDSEVDGSVARDAIFASESALGIPIVIDANAALADALAAEYATYSVVLDRAGTVRFRGGIDSDKSHLRADATPYLGDALEDLLGGAQPRRPEAKALGCLLQTR
jgi:hypothetical protein